MGKKKSSAASAQKPPGFDEQDKQQYNHAVLSRHDPHLYQIFFTSAICNVYKFNIDAGEWDKLNCQGTLFIFSRASRDQADLGDTTKFPYALMVLNRLSMENFNLGITPLSISSKSDAPEMDVKMEDPFIMVQASDGGMYGLWLFNEADRSQVLNTLDWCLRADTNAASTTATTE